MMGGDPQSIRDIQPELLAISAPGRLFPTGDLGSASTLKMVNQHLAGSHIAVAGEVLAFAKSLGLSTRQAHSLLMSSDGASWIMGDRGKTMLSADWAPQSAVDIFIKDLGIVIEAADNLHLSCPIASTAAELFMERSAIGHGRDDDASIVCNYEAITGKTVAEGTAPNGVSTNGVDDTESKPLALVVSDRNLHSQLVVSSEAQIISSSDSDGMRQSLGQLVPGTLIGVDEASLLSISPEYAHLVFFDYAVLSQVGQDPRILFTNSHHTIQGRLEAVLGANTTVTPVVGGSALAMAHVIDLAMLLHMAAAAENFVLAQSSGINPQLVYDLVNGAAGSSVQFSRFYPTMISKDFAMVSGLQSLEGAEETLRGIRMTMNALKFPGRLCNASYQMVKSARRQPMASGQSAAALVSAWI